MNRVRVCEHLTACIREDGRTIDGGEPLYCSMPPCSLCGALCPASDWTREGEVLEEERALERLHAEWQAHAERAVLRREYLRLEAARKEHAE